MAGVKEDLHLVSVKGGVEVSRCDKDIIFHLFGDHEGVTEFGKVDCAGDVSADGLKHVFAVAALLGHAVLLHPEECLGEGPLLLLLSEAELGGYLLVV